jgi:hypothetical protein
MNRTIDYFRRILIAEARDLQADLECMTEQQQLRFKSNEISEHVCLENSAVFGSEINSIDGFIALVERLDMDEVTTLDEVMALVRQEVRDRLEGTLRCPCVLEQLDRKMVKVRAYVDG